MISKIVRYTKNNTKKVLAASVFISLGIFGFTAFSTSQNTQAWTRGVGYDSAVEITNVTPDGLVTYYFCAKRDSNNVEQPATIYISMNGGSYTTDSFTLYDYNSMAPWHKTCNEGERKDNTFTYQLNLVDAYRYTCSYNNYSNPNPLHTVTVGLSVNYEYVEATYDMYLNMESLCSSVTNTNYNLQPASFDIDYPEVTTQFEVQTKQTSTTTPSNIPAGYYPETMTKDNYWMYGCTFDQYINNYCY